jgi:stage IV sporulation protein B
VVPLFLSRPNLIRTILILGLIAAPAAPAFAASTPTKVIPGGQTIGVKLKAHGILVVGHHLVRTATGNPISPAEQAGLQRGDQIVTANEQTITSTQQFATIVQRAGQANQPVQLTVKRDSKSTQLSITPALDSTDNTYRLGVYIRNQAAGVGTLTFYDPKAHVYGALGHVVTDMDTREPIPVGDGQIVYSKVISIEKGKRGLPGEKHAQFWQEDEPIGTIEQNTPLGVFGDMQALPDYGYTGKPMPVATINEVKEGPAQIYTVLNGHKVEAFDITIRHVSHQSKPALKGMVLRVTDKKLLAKTGGIVQGMSGSPIVQNGKLIGAVTHVLVNDPQSGYGCFAEWMLEDAEKVNAD